jgi:phospholipid transport system substrate-binding protein
VQTKKISIFLSSLALVGAVLTGAVRAADEEPKQVVEQITGQVIKVLADKSQSTEAKRAAVQQIVYAWVDFDTMSKLVLAANWKKLSEAQQKDFVDQFRQHLSNTYGRNVDSYRDEKVKVGDTREEARGDITVKTAIDRGGANDIFVDYRLRKIGGQWKIIDVVIERVSLVSNFRSQFQEVIAQSGVDRLLAMLKEKNAKGEGDKTAPKG